MYVSSSFLQAPSANAQWPSVHFHLTTSINKFFMSPEPCNPLPVGTNTIYPVAQTRHLEVILHSSLSIIPRFNQSPPEDGILSPADFAYPSTGLHCLSHYHPGSQGMHLCSGYVECEVQVGHSGGDVHRAAGHLDKRRETLKCEEHRPSTGPFEACPLKSKAGRLFSLRMHCEKLISKTYQDNIFRRGEMFSRRGNS